MANCRAIYTLILPIHPRGTSIPVRSTSFGGSRFRRLGQLEVILVVVVVGLGFEWELKGKEHYTFSKWHSKFILVCYYPNSQSLADLHPSEEPKMLMKMKKKWPANRNLDYSLRV